MTLERFNRLLWHSRMFLSMIWMSMFSNKYSKEARFVLRNSSKKEIPQFPYPRQRTDKEIVCKKDPLTHLPFVCHDNRHLFFPENMPLDYCEEMCMRYIEREFTTRADNHGKAPHQYQTEQFKVEEGDVMVDVGCAEALLSLDVIERVSHAYLIESEPEWIPALEATFAPWHDKVTIVNKYVSDKDSDTTIKLETLLACEQGKRMFIKMDIEGAEVDVLRGSKDFLRQNNGNIKLACCTYHRQNDAETIKGLYEEMGYDYEFSDGYMMFLSNHDLKFPYFTHGVIRGWKK